MIPFYTRAATTATHFPQPAAAARIPGPAADARAYIPQTAAAKTALLARTVSSSAPVAMPYYPSGSSIPRETRALSSARRELDGDDVCVALAAGIVALFLVKKTTELYEAEVNRPQQEAELKQALIGFQGEYGTQYNEAITLTCEAVRKYNSAFHPQYNPETGCITLLNTNDLTQREIKEISHSVSEALKDSIRRDYGYVSYLLCCSDIKAYGAMLNLHAREMLRRTTLCNDELRILPERDSNGNVQLGFYIERKDKSLPNYDFGNDCWHG